MTQDNSTNEIDLRRIFTILLNHWWWFAIGITLCLALGAFYYLRTTPEITTQGAIMLRQENENGMLGDLSALSVLGLSGNNMADDEVVVLSSRDLMHQAIDALDLWTSYSYKDGMRWKGQFPTHTFTVKPIALNEKGEKKGSFVVTIKIRKDDYKITVKQGRFTRSTHRIKDLSQPIETCIGTLLITQNCAPEEDITTFRAVLSKPLSVVDRYRKNIVVALNKKESNIIKLSTTSTMPGRDEALLRKMIEVYNMNAIVDKNIIATNTASFIDERLSVITKELLAAEEAVATYKASNNLTDLNEEAKIFLQVSSEEQKELAEVETQLNLVDYIEDFLQDDTKRFSLIPANIGVTDPSLTTFIGEYNTMILQRMRVLRTATDDNPVIESLNEQLLSMRQNIIASIASVRESLRITQSGLQMRDSQFNARIKSVPEQEREYLRVMRQQMLKEEIYVFLSQKREETALMLASTSTPAKVIDIPKMDTTTASPRLKMVALICIFFGLCLPAGLLYLVYLFDNKISDPDTYEKAIKAPFVAKIVENQRGKHIAISEGENTVSAELFRLLRTNLSFILPPEKKSPVILVTSSINGEGKSYIATNTALSLAILGKKVVLVGLDIRKPMLATYFNVANKGCLTSYLSDDAYTVEDTIQHGVNHPNLDLIPAGTIPPNPSELLQTDRLDQFFATLRQQYDYIIVDSAPVAMVSDTFLLNRIADMTLYVSRANYTPRNMIEFINGLVEQKRLPNLACVLNGVKNAKAGYGYGYGYGQQNTPL